MSRSEINVSHVYKKKMMSCLIDLNIYDLKALIFSFQENGEFENKSLQCKSSNSTP